MQKSILIVNSKMLKHELLLSLAAEVKKTSNEVYINIESLPTFLDTKVSFSVFFSSLRNFPKQIIWTSAYKNIFDLILTIDGIDSIIYNDYQELIGEKTSKSIGQININDADKKVKALDNRFDSVAKYYLGNTSQNSKSFKKVSLELSQDFSVAEESVKAETEFKKEAQTQTQTQNQAQTETASPTTNNFFDKSIKSEYGNNFFVKNKTPNNEPFENSSTNSREINNKKNDFISKTNLNKLDSLIEKLEKTKIDLSKKGKYPVRKRDEDLINSNTNWIDRIMPLTSVSSSFVFIIVLVVICFVILLQLFPLS